MPKKTTKIPDISARDSFKRILLTNLLSSADLNYPLMDQIITPFTKYFWMNGYTARIGSVDTMITAY